MRETLQAAAYIAIDPDEQIFRVLEAFSTVRLMKLCRCAAATDARSAPHVREAEGGWCVAVGGGGW